MKNSEQREGQMGGEVIEQKAGQGTSNTGRGGIGGLEETRKDVTTCWVILIQNRPKTN